MIDSVEDELEGVAELETEDTDVEEAPEISIHVITGSSCCSTMKVGGMDRMVNNRRL